MVCPFTSSGLIRKGDTLFLHGMAHFIFRHGTLNIYSINQSAFIPALLMRRDLFSGLV